MHKVDDKVCLVSHHPQGVVGDVLSYRDYANTICKILTEMTTENTGLTVGIFGDWGSGKSSILRMIGEQLETNKHGKNRWRGLWYRFARFTKIGRRLHNFRRLHAKPLVIRFSAWEYKEEQVWLALLRKIIQTSEQALWFWQAWWVKTQLWSYQVRWRQVVNWIFRAIGRFLLITLMLFSIFLGFYFLVQILSNFLIISPIVDWLKQVAIWVQTSTTAPDVPQPEAPPLLQWAGSALEVSSGAAALWIFAATILKGVWVFFLWMLNLRLTVPSYLLRTRPDFNIMYPIEQFRAELLGLIRFIGSKRPLVVLIDDLDRASVDQIVPVLEAIKHFGSEPDGQVNHKLQRKRAPIAFVLAVDRNVIQSAVASHYEKFYAVLVDKEMVARFAREYLEKIVQLPFELPTLTSFQLGKLLQTSADPYTPRYSISWAMQEALPIIVEGAHGNPRQTIQAYNTIQAIWNIVQMRNLQEEIDPCLLTTLVLIRYIWPDQFAQIWQYPELFFYLHAIARKEANSICWQTEIEELLTLDCPQGETTFDMIRKTQPELLYFIGASALPTGTDISGFIGYLTLSKEIRVYEGVHRIEAGSALMSGDPIQIKVAIRMYGRRAYSERLPWLLEFLEFQQPTKEIPNSTVQNLMERAIFALGRFSGVPLELLEKIIQNNTNINDVIVKRAIFAIAHQLNVSTNQEIALDLLAELLLQPQIQPGFRIRILRLIRPPLAAETKIFTVVVKIALMDELKLTRNLAHDLISRSENLAQEQHRQSKTKDGYQSKYLEIAFKQFMQAKEDQNVVVEFSGMLEQVIQGNTSILNNDRLEFLIKQAASPRTPLHSTAFRILRSELQSERAISLLRQVAITTRSVEIWRSTIEQMGERQQSCDDWQTDAWIAVFRKKVDETVIKTLGKTAKSGTVQAFREILANTTDLTIHQLVLQQLKMLADNIDDSIATAGQEAIQEYKNKLQNT